MKISPKLLKLLLNLYPPYLGTGIKITHISKDLEEIKRQTENGNKYLPEFLIEIKDDDNELVAAIRKILYVRKNRKTD